ncbi:hypothetical protein [Acinetobacter sp.]|uniref:hypothetical protein n=1 Tax=Acinetobacter sp. TaxID=472 RepID=UPI0037508551
MKLQTIEQPALITDDQSGGFSAEIFTTEEERLESINEHNTDKLTLEQVRRADYDEHERGYSTTIRLELKIDDDGNISLWKSAYMHGGQ